MSTPMSTPMSTTATSSFRDDPTPDLPVTHPVAEVPFAQPAEMVVVEEGEVYRWRPPMRLLPEPRLRESTIAAWTWRLLALAVAGLYLYALLGFWAPANPGTDQNGYFVGGRQFAQTFSTGLKPESGYGFIGRMWIMAYDGTNYPKYPLGLPILFASCIWLFGDDGYRYAHLISPISATLAALGVFAIVRRISGGFVGVLAMLLLACGQTMLTLADNPNSHAPGTATIVWGMFFLIRWLNTGSIWRGLLAGALLGFAYMIRYTDGLLALPIAVAMLYAAKWRGPTVLRSSITLGVTVVVIAAALIVAYTLRGSLTETNSALWPLAENGGRMFYAALGGLFLAAVVSLFITGRSLTRILAVGVAWLIPVAYLTIFNMVKMHSFTSYAGTNESTGFAWSYFEANWEKMVRVLHDQGLFFITPIGVLGLVLMFRRMPLVATILLLWFLPSVLLYTAYYWAPDNMGVAYSRFVLTQIPALVISAAWLLGEVIRRPLHSATARIAVGLLVFISCSVSIHRTVLGSEWGSRMMVRANLEVQARQNMNLAGLGDTIRRAVDGSPRDKSRSPRDKTRPPRDDAKVVLFADGERLNHIQWIGGWQLFPIDAFDHGRATGSLRRINGDTDDPDPIDPSRIRFLQALYKDKDQKALNADRNALIAGALDKGHRVFVALSDNQSKVFGRAIDRRQFDVKEITTYNDVPAPRTKDDFLTPEERPKQPVNRFGRGNAFAGPNYLGNERTLFRISQIVLKPTATSQSATQATTRPISE